MEIFNSGPGKSRGETNGPAANTMVSSTPLPGVAVDSAIRYRMISPDDSIRMTMQVFDLCTPGGRPLRSTIYSWSERGRYWISTAKEDLSYTREGDIRERQYYMWIDACEVYSMIEQESFSYRKGCLSKYEYEAYDPAMIGRKITTHVEEYDEQGRLVYQHTKYRTADLGWIDALIKRLDYSDKDGTVSMFSSTLKEQTPEPSYQEEFQVFPSEGQAYEHLLTVLQSRPGKTEGSPESCAEKVYYFYTSQDLLADQAQP